MSRFSSVIYEKLFFNVIHVHQKFLFAYVQQTRTGCSAFRSQYDVQPDRFIFGRADR